ncbi:TolB family protein [Marinococcus luteus]|uniref:TolB family protein n=1 Tax=Marinococcus luteus TaxID=1122204 RepID=UPI002ACCBB3F|nr:hypothetical protein [Marinococcus luteus]MDZ5784212.1 hypothetical protein [Marinococcus luteus]
MAQYSFIEKRLARLIESNPKIKKTAKFLYQRMQYALHRKKDFTYETHPEVKLETPYEHLGLEASDAPLFFGYYDRKPWNPSQTRLAYHRLNAASDWEIVALDGEKQQDITAETTAAFNFQQGSMTCWVDEERLLYNNFVDGNLVARQFNVKSEQVEATYPMPLQTLHPGENTFLSINFKNLTRLNPEYGYEGESMNLHPFLPREEDGIWKVNMDTQKTELIITIKQLIQHKFRPEMEGAEHKVNHVMYSPSGKQFIFMHRWIGKQGRYTRLYAAAADGSNVRLLLDDRMVSHCCWYNDDEIIAWARTEARGDHYYWLNTNTSNISILGEGVLDQYGDGHPSISPDQKWLVTDTYPDKSRIRHLFLYNLNSGEFVEAGQFFAPWAFDLSKRADLHPRWSLDGKYISIDSSHEGVRKSYILDVSSLIGKK